MNIIITSSSYYWSVFSCIQSEYREIQTRNNSVFGHFPAVSQSEGYLGICQKAINSSYIHKFENGQTHFKNRCEYRKLSKYT